jgi:hypothetical protein
LKSVYAVLSENEQFSEFLQACMGFGATEILTWAGIPQEPKQVGLPSPQDAFTIFTRDIGRGDNAIEEACLDYNVKMFNTYNYTLFAPDNTAMAKAQSAGLPTWEDIQALFQKYHNDEGDEEPAGNDEVSPQEVADQQKAYQMIRRLRDFVRFHFTASSVYADNVVSGGRYQTLCTDDMGVAREVMLSGGSGKLTVTAVDDGNSATIDTADSSTKIVNKMTRDYWFNANKRQATGITTSSFCAVHQISTPLYNPQ